MAGLTRRLLSAFFYPEGANHQPSALANAGHAAGTDKVQHDYEALYSKLFESMPQRTQVERLLEIGLGCHMQYGPGKSAQMWRSYFPNATIWMADVDSVCVTAHQPALAALNISAVVGDQSNFTTLKRWVQETGGNFDVIVNDGAHQNAAMYNSFITLFIYALKPGGVYVIEDLPFDSFHPAYAHKRGPLRMTDIIASWMTTMVRRPQDRWWHPNEPRPVAPWPLVPGMRSIECIFGACAFVKCNNGDAKCHHHPDFNRAFYDAEINAA